MNMMYNKNMTTNQAKDMNRNPDGKGGFGERPNDRSDGRWNKDESISYQYNKLLRMSPEQLFSFQPETVAQQIAHQRLMNAMSDDGLNDTKEVTDRTEGKAPQSIDMTSNGETIGKSVEVVWATKKK